MRIDDDVKAVLARCSTEGDALTLPGQLDRATYVRVNRVLEALGFKWERKRKAHTIGLQAGAEEALEAVLLTGQVVLPETFQFFPTPPDVVHRLVMAAQLDAGLDVLEPSSGDGAIALELSRLWKCNVKCIEIQEAKAAITADAGLPTMVMDFLTVDPRPMFDRVVMNPPFKRAQEAAHVLHALRFLRPEGRLISVMSAGIEFRQDALYAHVRDIIAARGGLIERLPDGAFRHAGTDVRTCMVVIPGEAAQRAPIIVGPGAYEKARARAKLATFDRAAGPPAVAAPGKARAVPPPSDFNLTPSA